MKIQKDWEASRLFDETAAVFYFNFNNATREFLKATKKVLKMGLKFI